MNNPDREKLANLLVSFSHACAELTEDEMKCAALIIEMFELKVRGLL